MNKSLFLIAFLVLGRIFANAQCGCNHTITTSGNWDGVGHNVQPGDKICVAAGTYTHIYITNVTGSSTQPVTIKNCGGIVRIGTTITPSGFVLRGCRYIKLSGSGSKHQYGFDVFKTSAGSSGIVADGKSSDVEIERCEVSGADFAGIVMKTDPSGCDSTTWRANFSAYNFSAHDCYMHDVRGEGFYIGNSFWPFGYNTTCSGTPVTVFPHEIFGLQIYNNRVERTGCEGIQFACGRNAVCKNNYVRKTGLDPFANFQNNGIQLGGGSDGTISDNYLEDVPSVGFINIGNIGKVVIKNNVLNKAGTDAVLIENSVGSLRDSFIVQNNTFANINGTRGYALYNDSTINRFSNNVFYKLKTGSPLFWYLTTAIQGKTVTTNQITASDADFQSVSDSIFVPTSTSLTGVGARTFADFSTTVRTLTHPTQANRLIVEAPYSIYEIEVYNGTTLISTEVYRSQSRFAVVSTPNGATKIKLRTHKGILVKQLI
jgi:hypothetical protein